MGLLSQLERSARTKNENRQKDGQKNSESENQTEESGNCQSHATRDETQESRITAIAACQHKHTGRRVIFSLIADRNRISVDLNDASEAFEVCLICGWWERKKQK